MDSRAMTTTTRTRPPGNGRRRGTPLLLLLALSVLSSCARKEAVLPVPPSPPPHRIEILDSRIEANDAFIEVRFRLSGGGRIDPDTSVIYLADDASGERFYTIRLQRVGKLAENGTEEAVHTVLFKNREGVLHPGSRVTLVVGSLRKEHVLRGK
jgi:hypothetical protein